jgi:uncharacterized protein (TIGR02246 family)
MVVYERKSNPPDGPILNILPRNRPLARPLKCDNFISHLHGIESQQCEKSMVEKLVATKSSDEQLVRNLYVRLLECWNNRDANGFADLFLEQGFTIGFDGSESNGKKEIQHHLSGIFAHHQTAAYRHTIRRILPIDPTIWMVRADVGMIPPGKNEINPDLNAIQTIVTKKINSEFKIVLLQNTPAAFHGRPEAKEKLTNELKNQNGK